MTRIIMKAIVACCGLVNTTERVRFSENVLIRLGFVITNRKNLEYQEELIQHCLKKTVLPTKKVGKGSSNFIITKSCNFSYNYVSVF